MQSNQLQRAINLTKKTGDRIIVFDKADSKDPCVVMSLDEYEKLAIGRSEVRGLTENELLDKINRDIAVWKSDSNFGGFDKQNNENTDDFDNFTEETDFIKEDDENDEDGDLEEAYREDFSSPGLKEMRKSLEKKGNSSKNSWSIPSDRKDAADEVVNEGEDEDRQYLEELPF